MAKKSDEDVRLMSKEEVLRRTGMSYVTIWGWMRDGIFPRSRDAGGKVFWLANEVEFWITHRPIKPLKGDPTNKVWKMEA